MTSRVKVTIEDQRKLLKKIQRDFAKKAPLILEREVINTIMRGGNPVNRGPRRLEGYSESYKKAIRKGRYSEFSKRVRPVNMRLSGDMLRSFKVTAVSVFKGVRAEFDNRLADIHNRLGAGKSKTVRRILPRQDVSGEQFSNNIMRKLTDLVEDLVKNVLR